MALKTDLRSSDDKKFKGHTEDTTIKVAAKPVNKLNLFKTFQQNFLEQLAVTVKEKIKKSIGKK